MYVVFIACQVGVIVGDSSLCCCGPHAFNVMCDVNCSSAITDFPCIVCCVLYPFVALLKATYAEHSYIVLSCRH